MAQGEGAGEVFVHGWWLGGWVCDGGGFPFFFFFGVYVLMGGIGVED